MRNRTIVGSIAAAAAVAGLGVYYGPSLTEHDANAAAPPAAVTSSAPEPVRTRAVPRARAVPKRDIDRMTIAPKMPATQAELQTRLKPVLNRGTKMELAAEGFRNAEQFAMVAHAARNTGVPFAVLKHRVLEENQTLAGAIRESKPNLDVEQEVTRARRAARSDISAIVG